MDNNVKNVNLYYLGSTLPPSLVSSSVTSFSPRGVASPTFPVVVFEVA